MAILPILTWPDHRLVQICAPVPGIDDGVRGLAQDLLDTLYDAGGRGLAAPQIGVLRQVFVMDAGWKNGTPTPMVFVNPLIRSSGGERCTGPEGCLSIPGVEAQVVRHSKVALSWTGLDGDVNSADFDGFEAVCVQHEIDHLEGIVTLLRVDAQQRATLEAEYYA